MSPPERPGSHTRWAVFLDVDGTLLELAETPDRVRIPSVLPPLLAALDRLLGGALALVSGRSLADLDGLFAPLRLAAAGVHGAELRLRDGTVHRVAVDVGVLDPVRHAFAAFAAEHPGVIMEDKGFGVTLHYRLAPTLADDVRVFGNDWAARIGDDFQLLEGKMIVELRVRAATKGTAVHRFLDVPPFAGCQPVYLGDDVTDEDAFSSVNALGGVSVQVGERQPSEARYRLASVSAVHAWLGHLVEQLDRSGGGEGSGIA